MANSLNDNDRLVLSALCGAARPLSAYEILDRTRPSAVRAPTQVYRSLEKLKRQGLVHKVQALSAFVACSDQHDGRHRPGFLVCRDCGVVREFEPPKVFDYAEEAAGAGFSVESVSLEILGRCSSCSQ